MSVRRLTNIGRWRAKAMPTGKWLGRLRIASLCGAIVVILWGGWQSWVRTVNAAEAEARIQAELLASQLSGITRAQFILHDAIAVRVSQLGTDAAGLFGFILFGMLRAAVASQVVRAGALERAEAAERLARHHATLVKEMSHRIKNNLSIVAALVRFDAKRYGSVRAEEVSRRIEAIASLHDMLYMADDGMTADLGKLLSVITCNPAIIPPEKSISVVINVPEPVSLDSKLATSLAMIIVEIVTNAVKHAFDNTADPALTFAVAKGPSATSLTIADNGSGLPDAAGRKSGSGLVSILAEGAGIAIKVEAHQGTRFCLSFAA